MYPQRDLKAIAWHKTRLRRRIAGERAASAAAVVCLVQPLAWFDRVRAQWAWISPLLKIAAVPVGLLAKRSAAPGTRVLGALLRWGPLVWNLVRGRKAARS